MKTIAELYSPDALAYYRREYRETPFMVHVIGPDDVLLHSDINDDDADYESRVPFTLETADQATAAINRTYQWTQENNPSEFDPFFQATVFHYGKPLVAPDAVAKAPELSTEELAWFKDTWAGTEWVAYIHGQDECFDRSGGEDGPLFTEETLRRFVANTVLLDREMTAQGYDAPIPVSVFHFGEPFALETAAAVAP